MVKNVSHADVSAPSKRDAERAATARYAAGQGCGRCAGENGKEEDEKEENAAAERRNLVLFRIPLCHFHHGSDRSPAGGTQGRCGTLGAALAWRSDVSIIYAIAKAATK